MEKSKPSFVPEWLKGTSGGGVTVPQVGGSYTDHAESLFVPRGRLAQQQNVSTGNLADYDSSRGSTCSGKVFSPYQRNQIVNACTLGVRNEENVILGRSHTNIARGYSNRGLDMLDREKDVYKGNSIWEEKDVRSREMDKFVGFGSDEREGDREKLENDMVHIRVTGSVRKFEHAATLHCSQSLGLSPRNSDGIAQKLRKSQPINGSLASSIQKAAFERNFPSLGTDEKPGGLSMSSMSSPHPQWQGLSRFDLGWSTSPLLPGIATSTTQSFNEGVDPWSSALADVSLVNGDTLVNILSANSSSSTSTISCTASPVTSMAPLNMAEVLTQNPPRALMPPQSLVDSQRLEELALKQSRQLIPVTPSLPKTSLADKNKSRSLRSMDNGVKNSSKSSQSAPLQINSLHRSLTCSSRPDNCKQQGKFLFLRSNKEMPTAGMSKIEVPNGVLQGQGAPPGNVVPSSQSSSGAGVSKPGQRKVVLDRRASFAGVDVSRLKEPMEDKRAQERIEFFNALRKKAASIGSGTSLQVSTEMDSVVCSHEVHDKVTGIIHGNGDIKCPSMDNPSVSEESLLQNLMKSRNHVLLPLYSEEEEVAFMRSIGWEENAENSELTEDEIKAFYEMRESRKVLNHQECDAKFAASVGSLSSVVSSSDSESDTELQVLKK